jgi:hypothetical protein
LDLSINATGEAPDEEQEETDEQKEDKEHVYSQEYLDAVSTKTVLVFDNRSPSQVISDVELRQLHLPNGGGASDFFSQCKTLEEPKSYCKVIHPDHFNTKGSGGIEDSFVVNRLMFLNIPIVSETLKKDAYEELKSDCNKCFNCAVRLLTNLLVAVSRCYNIKLGHSFPANAKQICDAFGEINNRAEGEPFWHVYYGYFDRYRLWQKLLETAILHEMGWKYDDDAMKLRRNIKGIRFKVASDAINALRKQVSEHGGRNCGFTLTIKRNSSEISEENRFQRRTRAIFQSKFVKQVAVVEKTTRKRKKKKEWCQWKIILLQKKEDK